MARAKQAPRSSQRSLRSQKQPANEAVGFAVGPVEATTQPVQSKRRAKPAKSSQPPKTSNRVAKKSAQRSVPQKEPEIEPEAEDEEK